MRLVSILVATGMTILAAPITGVLNFTGNARISDNSANFLCDLLGSCSGSNGDLFITGGSANSGTFAQISILDRFGQIKDVANPPLDTPFLLPQFVQFVANPDVTLDLTEVFSGAGDGCPPTLVTSCTPPGSPLNLLQTQTGTLATFSVLANAHRISTGEITPYKGLFTLQFTQPPAVLLSGGAISTSYSATFSPLTPVPEVGNFALLGTGMVLIAFVHRRKRA